MPEVIYILENAIDSFFSEAGASSSKRQCDDVVRQRYGGQIRSVDIQGLTSYTLIAGPSSDKIIQFREQTALLDMNMLALAKEIHGDVLPRCWELGWVGDTSGSPLVIYEMNKLPGDDYIIARPCLAHDKQRNTVHSLASFFASAWQKGTLAGSKANTSAISTECYARLKYLVDSLPGRFLPAVTEVQAALPALLDGSYPLVLTHSDLNEMDILVDPFNGNITGVVDWPGASIQPFGFTLYALENAFGNMGSEGWKWFDNAENLRDNFRKTFREQTGLSEHQERAVKLAGKAGILIRYGTAYDSGFSGMTGVRDPNSEDFRYPDAFLFESCSLRAH